MTDGTLLAPTHPAAISQSFNVGNQHSVETTFGLVNTVVCASKPKPEIVLARKYCADFDLRIQSARISGDLFQFEAGIILEEGASRTTSDYALNYQI